MFKYRVHLVVPRGCNYNTTAASIHLRKSLYVRNLMAAADYEPVAGSQSYDYGSWSKRRNQRNQYVVMLIERFCANLVSITLIPLGFRHFIRVGVLDDWAERAFNTVAILCTGIMGLTMGSLLRLLGEMLRWKLLSREKHTVRRVGKNSMRNHFELQGD